MPTYLVEFYASRFDAGDEAAIRRRTSEATAALTRDGVPVKLVQAIAVPAEELYLCLFEAASADAVREAMHLARLPADGSPSQVRVLEAGAPDASLPRERTD